MKQAIYIFCLYIGLITFLTLTLFREPLEFNVAVSLFAALAIAGTLFVIARGKKDVPAAISPKNWLFRHNVFTVDVYTLPQLHSSYEDNNRESII